MCLQRGITLEIAWVTFLRPELTFVVDWVLTRHIRCLRRWLFPRARGFGGGGGEVRRVIPRLRHFFFSKVELPCAHRFRFFGQDQSTVA